MFYFQVVIGGSIVDFYARLKPTELQVNSWSHKLRCLGTPVCVSVIFTKENIIVTSYLFIYITCFGRPLLSREANKKPLMLLPSNKETPLQKICHPVIHRSRQEITNVVSLQLIQISNSSNLRE